MNDPLDELLTPPSAPEDGTKLRQALLARSTDVLRRRRRLRQVAGVGALAACFLAGMATMRWFPPAPVVQIVYREAEPHTEPTPQLNNDNPSETAVAVENRALDATDRRERGELYRKAAELYRSNGDYANWVRCKGNALDEGTSEDLIVTPDYDSITIVMKRERQKKESRDARIVD
jgi:hypothetical protein